MDEILHALDRYRSAAVSFAIASIQEAGSARAEKAMKLYDARKATLVALIEKRGQ